MGSSGYTYRKIGLASFVRANILIVPSIASDWWTIATNPDLGPYSTPNQQPMDFGIWQAADETWQLGACIRGTGCGGHGRLLYRWEASSLKNTDWQAKEIILEADVTAGETLGGLQAPFVIRDNERFVMVYGDWVNICMATSQDGKLFTRHLSSDGVAAIFSEGVDANTRDPMLFCHAGIYYAYYTGVVNNEGAIYCRTSKNLLDWSDSRIVSRGGSGGTGPSDAECAFVCYRLATDAYYLFRWHSDGLTSVYQSDDPLDFGVNSDSKRICTLPVEVARIISFGGNTYISSTLEDYSGIRLARMAWINDESSLGHVENNG
jgi:hypothetical protein